MKTPWIVIAAASLFVSGAAFAAADFPTVDANADGQITREEAAAHAPEMTDEEFEQADSNRDGSLSPGEYITAMTE